MENKSLAGKLFEVQKELEPVTKNKNNPFFKSKYADINAFIEMVRPILLKHRLVLLQPLSTTENGVPAITTMLLDCETGEKIQDTTPIITNEQDPQKMGSAITYYRRYALQSFLFIQAEDDDANKASGNTNAPF